VDGIGRGMGKGKGEGRVEVGEEKRGGKMEREGERKRGEREGKVGDGAGEEGGEREREWNGKGKGRRGGENKFEKVRNTGSSLSRSGLYSIHQISLFHFFSRLTRIVRLTTVFPRKAGNQFLLKYCENETHRQL
jgi:hypothetical protein